MLAVGWRDPDECPVPLPRQLLALLGVRRAPFAVLLRLPADRRRAFVPYVKGYPAVGYAQLAAGALSLLNWHI